MLPDDTSIRLLKKRQRNYKYLGLLRERSGKNIYVMSEIHLHLCGERQRGAKFLNVQGDNIMKDLALKPLNIRSEA